MGMSTRVEGFRPPDALWEQMEAIWEACTRAGVPVPDEVAAFFEDGKPDPTGVEVDLGASGAVRPWRDDYREGFEVDVRKLPRDVTVLRFYNSW
jgi:hypothetical protein